MFKQQGIFLAPATINGWFAEVAGLMRPSYYRLQELVVGSDYIQSDGYAVYDIYENKKGVQPIGCCAHVRRKFDEALSEDKARASYALEQISLLYDVERQADQESLSFDQRAELRSRLAYPIMVAFEKWLLNEFPKVLPKGRIGKAIRYTYNIYHKLTRYHLDGRLKMDNNLGENAVRPRCIRPEKLVVLRERQRGRKRSHHLFHDGLLQGSPGKLPPMAGLLPGKRPQLRQRLLQRPGRTAPAQLQPENRQPLTEPIGSSKPLIVHRTF